jgi:hypothetical protein
MYLYFVSEENTLAKQKYVSKHGRADDTDRSSKILSTSVLLLLEQPDEGMLQQTGIAE